MKKTLFLAVVMACIAIPAQAGTIITGTGTEADLNNATGTVSVGSHKGVGVVNISDGATADLGDYALFIGGSGYYSDGVSTSGANGTVNMGAASTLTTTNHIDVGSSQYAVTGTLIVGEGATVNATQLVVGSGNGIGKVIVKSGADLDITNNGTDYNGIIVGGGDGMTGNAQGTLTIEDGARLDLTDTDIYVGVYGNGKGVMDIHSSDVDLAKLHIGSGADATGTSTSTGIVNITAATATAAAPVSADVINVCENGTLNVTGTALDVDGAGTSSTSGMFAQGGTINISNSDVATSALDVEDGTVTITNGAEVTSSQETYVGDAGVLTVKTADLISGGTATVDDNAVVELANEANWTIKDGASLDSSSSSKILFTTDSWTQTTGQITFKGDSAASSTSQGAEAVIRFTGDVAEQLLAGNTTVRLTSQEDQATDHQVSFGTYTWEKTNGTTQNIDITEDTTNTTGTLLQLTNQDGLVDEIVQDLSVDATQAAVNSMNASLANMGAMFDTIKMQLNAPHNVEMPVGNIATDSKLAHSGRYMVGANRVWGAGMAISDRRATDKYGTGYHYEGGGYAVGYDRIITPNMFVGASIGNIFGKYKANNGLMRDSQKATEFALYGRHTTRMAKSGNRLNIDAYIGYGIDRNRGRGYNYVGGVESTGRWNDQTLGGGVTVSYEMDLSDSSTIIPFVGIEGKYAWQNDFVMASSQSNTTYSDGTASLWTIPVGVTYRYTQAISGVSYFIPEVTVAYLGDVSHKHPKAEYTRAGSASSVNGRAYGAIPDRSGFELQAGATYIINSQWMTGAFYTIDERDGDCEQTVKAHVSYSF